MTTLAVSPLLRHRNLRWLLTGSTVNIFGGAITPVALAFAVLDLGGSATELGIVEAVFAVCQVATSLVGGVLGDRVSRQVMMEGACAASALVVGLLAASVIVGFATIPLLTALGAVSGVLGALSQPSSRAMTRLVVPEPEIGRAVALRALLQTSAATAGYAVSGVLVSAIGSGWAIAVDAATYVVAAAIFARLEVPNERPPKASSVLADLGEGLREVLRHDWLWFLILQATLYHLFYGGVQSVLGPIVVGQGLSRSAWGLALAVLMGGFLVGNLVCLRWRPRRSLRVGVLLLAMTGLFPLSMALSDNLWPILAGALLHGLGLQIFSVFWETSINEHVPEEKLARVYSFDIVGSFIARPVGLVLTGPVATAAGFDAWLIVVACVVSGSSLVALTFPGVRRLEASDPT